MLWAAISAMQNVVAVIVLRVDRLGVPPPPGDPAGSPHLQPRRARDPRDDRRRRRHRAAGAGRSRSPATATSTARSSRTPWRCRCAGRPGAGSRPSSPCCGGATSRWSRRSSATCRSRSTSTSPRASRTSCSASSRRAASCRSMDLEDETATFGLKTLQDLGWKDLLDGFTCTECGRCQAGLPRLEHRASRSTPRPSSWASATCRSMPSTGSTSSRTRRSSARRTAWRTRDPRPRRWPARSSTPRSRTTRSGTA